jgi:hypothetical protein
MLHNWSGQVNDPVLVKFYLGSVRVEHSIQQAIHEKMHNEGRNKERCLDHLIRHKMFHETDIIIQTRNSTAKACVHVKNLICKS